MDWCLIASSNGMRPYARPCASRDDVGQFISKWRASELKESAAARSHFNDRCRILGEPTPTEANPTGTWYCFEDGARNSDPLT